MTYELTSEGANQEVLSRALARQSPLVVVAVGPAATRLARTALPRTPMVCAWILDPGRLSLGSGDLYWISPQADPAEVVKALRAVAPRARTLGLVTSSPESPYLARLRESAGSAGIELRALEARSEAA